MDLRSFKEFADATILIGGDATKRTRVSYAHEMHGQICVLFAVGVQNAVEIRTGEHIAVEHNRSIVTQLVVDVSDATTSAQRLILDDIFNFQAHFGAISEVFLEDFSFE